MDDWPQEEMLKFAALYEKHCGERPDDLRGVYFIICRKIQSPEVSAGYVWDKVREKERLKRINENLKAVLDDAIKMPRFLSEKIVARVSDNTQSQGKMVPLEDVLPSILETVEACSASFEQHANWGEGSRKLNLVSFNVVEFAAKSMNHHGIEFAITEHSKYPTKLQSFVADIFEHFGIDASARSAIRAFSKETSHS